MTLLYCTEFIWRRIFPPETGDCFLHTKCCRFKLDLYCSALRGYGLSMDVAADDQ